MAHNTREWIVISLLTVLMLSLYISASFRIYNESIKQCQERNFQISEVNDRTRDINLLLHITRKEHKEHAHLHGAKQYSLATARAHKVPLTDCYEDFSKPWPFE